MGNYIAQNGQGATIENGIGKFNKVKLPKIAGYKAMIKQIPSANTLNQLFMIRFIAAPSKKKKLMPIMKNSKNQVGEKILLVLMIIKQILIIKYLAK